MLKKINFNFKGIEDKLLEPIRAKLNSLPYEPLLILFIISFGLAFLTNRKFLHARWYYLIIFTFVYFFALRFVVGL